MEADAAAEWSRSFAILPAVVAQPRRYVKAVRLMDPGGVDIPPNDQPYRHCLTDVTAAGVCR